MDIKRLIAVAVLVASANLGIGHAQSLARSDGTPAEFPPSSFKAKQYVDSRGCVFIRAGIDGNVTWVPRVNRARKQICGAQPSLGTKVAAAPAAKPKAKPVAAAKPAAVVKPAPKVKPKPRKVAKAAVRKPAPAAKPKVRRVVKPKPVRVIKPAPVRTVAAPKPAVAPAPKVVAAPKAPARKVVRARTAPATPACPSASALSRRYINSGVKLPVRCGPQAMPVPRSAPRQVVAAPAPAIVAPAPKRVAVRPATVARPAVRRPVAVAAQTQVTGQTRVVPKHVYIDRLNTRRAPVPQGYRRVWEDDRLNPYRAEQTLNGHATMNLIWTSQVPRRLINQVNGADVTASVPLVYPYVDLATQQRELGTVTIERREGVLVKRIQRNTARAPKRRTPTLSTRSAPAATPAPKAAAPATRRAPKGAVRITGKGYVQLGLYDQAAGAQAAAQRAKRLGLSARVGKFERNGQTLRMVLVGPYGSADAQRKALSQVKRAGFGNARLR